MSSANNFAGLPQLEPTQYEYWSFMLHAHIRAQCGADTEHILEVGLIKPQIVDRTQSTYQPEAAPENESPADKGARELRNERAQASAQAGTWRDKQPDEFTGDDRRRDNLDGLILNTLIHTVPRSLQVKLRGCKTACSAWQTIRMLCEGSIMAKKNKVDAAKRKFTMFAQKANESIESLDLRFAEILNELEALGEMDAYSESDKALAIIRSLNDQWSMQKASYQTHNTHNTETYISILLRRLTQEFQS